MKYKHYLETIAGIGIYPLISFVLFFVFFLFVSYYVLRSDKKHIDEVANIPLDNNEKF
ncbi:CcoQ/FixQ family Cbb3-type cytochrome c oxidase assembly chaperone [Aurantibacillus circumpalustris]|uniref:CcoQ/FixQ family Cbb3-type cytochrome c oxidase assembly chaperone n=1 Tax=Aurantibacillus circumpalustris TaxID=3036359 RepID=UPI00295A9193|nr:CcoQ/FixQ family Cbb3-type cytochrome c oxidase assembly chaperone [Aurantibacillus circumpalustris]